MMSIDATKLTYSDYCLFPDDGQRHEVIEGEHYVNPAPSPYHQDVSRLIQYQLITQIELPGHGKVFNAPIDLQLTPSDIVQPDLVVVMNDRRIITPTKIKGVPNLVVEILSPSSDANDRGVKFSLYEKTGVDEYWIVNPVEHEVEQHVLISGKYKMTRHQRSIICRCIQPTTHVDLTKVW
ncbi:MAG: Uma2 family endonuclease [Planctomycetota bacterium]